MGSSCISKQKDTLFEDTCTIHSNSKEKGIQNINQTIVANFQYVKLRKESFEEGIQISNIQTIVISPRCELEGAKIVGDLVKLGNKITIIQKRIPQSPNGKSIYKKGILKNKQETNLTQSIDQQLYFTSSRRESSYENNRFKG